MEKGSAYMAFLSRLPSVAEPVQRIAFKGKLKWTGMILLIYFLLAQIQVYGVGEGGLQTLRNLEILLGSSFGSLMSLGIGPIVTASIILQLLVGSKIIPWDLGTQEGKMIFQGTQKLLAIILCFVEAVIFVNMGAVPAMPGFGLVVILQLAAGGILVIFMDEVIQRYGFGSGVSLFILAGVSKTILVRAFNPLTSAGTFPGPGSPPVGLIPFAFTAIGAGELTTAFLSMLPLVATLIVFFLVVYTNAIKVEIPLAFGSIRGFGRRWPLKFFYTSNIPVILIAALLANVQLMGSMLANQGHSWIAVLDSENRIVGGLLYFFTIPTSDAIGGLMTTIGLFALLGALFAFYTQRRGWKITIVMGILGGFVWFGAVTAMGLTGLTYIEPIDMLRMLTYSLFLIGGAVVFSVFWVTSAGMDAKAVANQIHSTGMQIPGYRRDIRIIERVLNRYIPPLAVLGGAAVGFLAAFADFTGALGTGTGLLLATMIVFNLYEELASQHMEDMHPALRKLMGQ
jgi:preprotein translocase subunit SecY